MHARLEIIKRTTDLRQEADKNLRPKEKRHKKDYDRLVRFALVFRAGDHPFLDRPLLFRSAAKHPASEGYNKLLLRKQGPHKVIAVSDTTL